MVYPTDCYFGIPALATFAIVVPCPPGYPRHKRPDCYVGVAMQLRLLSYQRVDILLGVPGPFVSRLRSSIARVDVECSGAGAL